MYRPTLQTGTIYRLAIKSMHGSFIPTSQTEIYLYEFCIMQN